MDISHIKIIWCDINFENENSYRSMKNEFNETIAAIEQKPVDPIDMEILDDGKKELEQNAVPVTTVQTIDDTIRAIKHNKSRKVYIICSGSIGRFLVPTISRDRDHEYPYVHKVYVFAHNLLGHVGWADDYKHMVRLFEFHTDLLVRLTRDISYDFIEHGQSFLQINAPKYALPYFIHARNLEIAANRRDKTDPNSNEPDFRERLNILEGENGLIYKTKEAIQSQNHSLETS